MVLKSGEYYINNKNVYNIYKPKCHENFNAKSPTC